MKSERIETILTNHTHFAEDRLSVFDIQDLQLEDAIEKIVEESSFNVLRTDNIQNILHDKTKSNTSLFNSIEGVEMYYSDLLEDLEYISEIYHAKDEQAYMDVLLDGIHILTDLVLGLQHKEYHATISIEEEYINWYQDYFDILLEDDDFVSSLEYAAFFKEKMYQTPIIENFL